MAEREGVDRRGFLRSTAAVAATSGLIFGDWSEAQAADLPKRRLGRTNFGVTTISFGAIQLNSSAYARVLEHAIDRGVNLVHVSPGYQKGKAIQVVGEVMRRKRDQVFLALKVGPGNIDRHLRTLNTDYVDILIPPMAANRMGDTRIRDAMEQTKAAGKARFLGFATHDNMAATVRAAVQAGFWDCVLLKYNIGCRNELNPVVRDAIRRQKMGFLVMKSNEGLNRRNVGQWQAGLRNLLANEDLTSLTLGVGSTQHVDQNIAAVLQRSGRADIEFARYAAACAGGLCSSCGRCEVACPHGVAVMDYLRAGQYRDRGDGGLARELVRSIPARRSMAMCNNCGMCDAACHRNLAVLEQLRDVAGI